MLCFVKKCYLDGISPSTWLPWTNEMCYFGIQIQLDSLISLVQWYIDFSFVCDHKQLVFKFLHQVLAWLYSSYSSLQVAFYFQLMILLRGKEPLCSFCIFVCSLQKLQFFRHEWVYFLMLWYSLLKLEDILEWHQFSFSRSSCTVESFPLVMMSYQFSLLMILVCISSTVFATWWHFGL